MIELFAAMFVLAVAILGLASVATASLAQLRASRDRDLATAVASSAIETMRGLDYDDLAVYDPSNGAPECYDDEQLIETSDATTGVDFIRSDGQNARFDVTTYVTWFDESSFDADSDEEALGDCGGSAPGDAKRVTVVTAWSSANGVTREVRQSTVIAEAGRGLPVPDFRLLPTTQPIPFTPTELGTEKCVSHLLTNTGAEDSYEWEPLRVKEGNANAAVDGPADGTSTRDQDGDETTADEFVNGVFTMRGNSDGAKDVEVRALFEYNVNHDPDDESSSSFDPGIDASDVASNVPKENHDTFTPPFLDPDFFEEMIDGTSAESGSSPDDRPETTRRVPNREDARLWLCYLVPDDTASGTTFSVVVRVNSQFDEDRFEEVTHTVTVGEDPLFLHLFDPEDDDDHQRNVNSAYEMGVLDEDAGVSLGVDDPDDGEPFDWDTNLDDTYDLPFVWLGEDEGDSVAVRWDYQFQSETRIDAEAGLSLWSAPTPALITGFGGSRDVRLAIELERLQTNEKSYSPQQVLFSLDGTDAADAYEYTHTTSGWEEQSLTMGLTPDGTDADGQPYVEFEAGEYVRLTVWCLSSSTNDDCNVAYDHEDYPSYLFVDRLTS